MKPSGIEISFLFIDIGGVLLSNGFDIDRRQVVCDCVGIDRAEFDCRHDAVRDAFERGRLSTAEYLESTLHGLLPPSRFEEFRALMMSQTNPNSAALAAARKLAETHRHRMAALSNESLELNERRIADFRLRDIFSLFFSSCYTGLRKPEEAAFRMAHQVTQQRPEECLFLDDRPENVEAAVKVGMRTELVRDPEDVAGILSRYTLTRHR